MFNFGRRINGLTYYTGLGIACLVTFAIAGLASLPRLGLTADATIGLVILCLVIALFVYIICLIKQRANDIGQYPLLIMIICIVTPGCLILGLISGQDTANRFGPVPQRGISLR